MANPTVLPADVIVNLLDAHVSLTKGTNLFSCPIRPPSAMFPRDCVFVWSWFGYLPRPYIGVGKDHRRFNVDAVLRYGPDDFEDGRALAFGMWSLLQRADASIYDAGYFDCTCRDSEPAYNGVDDNGNHRWTVSTFLQWVG